MTDKQKAAMQQALNALTEFTGSMTVGQRYTSAGQMALDALPLLRDALAGSTVEPVAWKHDCAVLLTNDVELWIDRCPHCGKPRTKLTASPPPPAELPLLDDRSILCMWHDTSSRVSMCNHYKHFARAIEQAVWQKVGIKFEALRLKYSDLIYDAAGFEIAKEFEIDITALHQLVKETK